MRLLELIVAIVGSNSILLSFLGGFLSEDILLFLTILAGTNIVPLYHVLLFGFLGIMLHDTLFFFLGRSRFISYLKNFVSKDKRKELIAFVHKYNGKGYFVLLAVSKFIYGIRAATIFYASHKEKSYLRFFIFNTLSILLWFVVMIPLGWLAGRGFSSLLQTVTRIEKLLLVVIIGLILFYVFRTYLRKVLEK